MFLVINQKSIAAFDTCTSRSLSNSDNWFKTNKLTLVILATAKVGGIQSNKIRPAEFFNYKEEIIWI